MKLVTYKIQQQEARVGFLYNDLIVDVQRFGSQIGICLPTSMLELIDYGKIAIQALNEGVANMKVNWLVGTSVPATNATILAPIPKPRKNIFGIGLNYTEHVAESARSLDTSKELPQKCVIFSKPTNAIIGPFDAIQHNENVTKQLDYEGELAVIMGSKATKVGKENALDYVFGYSIINDISARDCRRSGQWIVSKGQDTFAPFGPVIVTADELTNPHNLNLRTLVNGVEKQNSNTKFLLFDVNDIIADISESMTLDPGDIIATGTPAGVGAGRTPQEWMWPGDQVEVIIEGIGSLKNPIVKAF
ncbi:MAG: gentisate 1,2-dioxygenase [Flavobacteriaceae bacterium]|nr:MAG: gentisate 1,2-dioxygenase [Flavobacteriaceae bacterium]